MEGTFYLHAGHQVRETLDGLALASWLAIGLAAGALVLSWGRLLGWLRAADGRDGPRLVRWGEDERGCYFEVAGSGELEWLAERADGRRDALVAAEDGVMRCSAGSPPLALISSGGDRLPL